MIAKCCSSAAWIRLGLLVYVLGAWPATVPAVTCPTGGATLTIKVNNPDLTTIVPSVTLSGAGIFLSCAGNSTTNQYSRTITNLMPRETRRVDISQLTTGVWDHHISVGIQHQSQRGAVLVGSSSNATPTPGGTPTPTPNNATINWTVFPAVITVNSPGEGFSQCQVNQPSTTCKLRDAFAQAMQHNAYGGEKWLIQLAVSPGIIDAGSLVFGPRNNDYTFAPSITLDGTDANGNPWIVGDPNAAAAGSQSPFTNVVDFHNSGGFIFKTADNTIQGLAIKNTLPPGEQQAYSLVSVLNPMPGVSYPHGNLLRNVQIDGGNRQDCNCPGPSCGCTGPDDLINVDEAGVEQSEVTLTVANVEGFAGLDKGVKAADSGWVVVNDSWIHHNYRGGIQATVSTTGNTAGIVTANRNVIENSGLRYLNGSPTPGAGAPTPTPDNHQVDAGANGLASHGTAGSTLTSSGNISRINVQHGAFVDNTSSLHDANDYLCGNGDNGVAASGGGSPSVSGEGIGAVYNAGFGVALASFSQADFGGGPLGSGGNNAFAENASGCDFQNLATHVYAENNQWTNGSPRTCGSGQVHRDIVQSGPNSPLSLSSPATFPGNAFLPGQTIRIYGAGFNADGGNPAPTPGTCVEGLDAFNSCCLTVASKNTCSGTHTPNGSGNCVEYQSSANSITQLTVTAVTPTMVVAAVPGPSSINCVGRQASESVWVSKKNTSGTVLKVNGAYCTNSGI